MENEVSKLVAMLERRLEGKAPPNAPKLRLVEPAAKGMCANDRDWMCDQIRFLGQAWGLDWLVRQECRGFLALEAMPDDDLRRVYRRIGHAIDCRKSGIPFEDTDLIDYDTGYDDAC